MLTLCLANEVHTCMSNGCSDRHAGTMKTAFVSKERTAFTCHVLASWIT